LKYIQVLREVRVETVCCLLCLLTYAKILGMKNQNYKDKIFLLAKKNCGVVTTQQMNAAGIPNSLIRRYCKINDDFTNESRGVYALWEEKIDTTYTIFAIEVAKAGEGSFLYGEGVLNFLELALVSPVLMPIAVPTRRSKTIDQGVRKVIRKPNEDKVVKYYGIPCQRLEEAFFQNTSDVDYYRLLDGINEAEERKLISKSAARRMIARLNKERNVQTAA
jgi:hypothetical protein